MLSKFSRNYTDICCRLPKGGVELLCIYLCPKKYPMIIFFNFKVQICEWLVMCFCLKYNQGGKSPIMNETTNYIKSLQKSWMVSNDSKVCLEYPSKYSNLYLMTNGFLTSSLFQKRKYNFVCWMIHEELTSFLHS